MDDHHLNHSAAPPQARGWAAASAWEVLELGRDWLLAPALSDLLKALDGPGIAHPDQDLPALLQWSAAVLDTRHGAERQAAAPSNFPARQVSALLAAAGPLGLLATTPPTTNSYDTFIVLGGTTTGNELRAQLARELVGSLTQAGKIIGLTAARPLTSAERATTNCRTEAEHLDAVLEATFITGIRQRGEPPSSDKQPGPETITAPSQITTMTAASSRAGQRADTRDAITCLIERIPPRTRQKVLIITSAIYAPYQFLVAAPLLLASATRFTEIAGTPTATSGPSQVLAQRIAQEIHATITALARSHVAKPSKA